MSSKEKITGFFSIFNPIDGYFVTPLLIICNLLIFIAMIYTGTHFLFPDIQDLLDWGANYRPFTVDGQWWRLLVSCFLHIGILHLLFNMYALFYIGLLLEPYLGKARFLAAYLISGIAASIASIWWNGMVVSAGASGAIFGMYGVFLALLSTNLVDKSIRKSLFTSIGVFVVYNLVNGLNPNNGVDNAAHIGGLLTGFVLGYGFVPSLKNLKIGYSNFQQLGE
ncbi:rhomboid family intramembrane serine protease [Algoriphagus halophilus]|uniref:rhomboid family intramembrane serine protease n=1 Tax=Algoriphagus halophilus TaxID=226505 RepID=UPI00358E78AA